MPGQRAAAEGHDVDARHLVLQPLRVAEQRRHVREDLHMGESLNDVSGRAGGVAGIDRTHPVREADGLRGLQVREARHEQVHVLLRQRRHRQQQLRQEALTGC